MDILGITQPKTEAGLRLRNALVALLLTAVFLYLYLVPLQSPQGFSTLPSYLLFVLITFSVLIIDLVIFAHDPLQYGDINKNKYARFFTSQFPSAFIAQKYNISMDQARNKWFSEFNKWQNPEHQCHEYRVRAFQIGYQCREIYHMQVISKYLAILSFIFLVFIFTSGFIPFRLPDFYYATYVGVPIILRIVFPLFLVFLSSYLKIMNNVDRPTGVWLRWKQHNDLLKARWLDNHPI